MGQCHQDNNLDIYITGIPTLLRKVQQNGPTNKELEM